MPKVSAVPGSPQSSTSTLKDSVVVPVDRITWAVPVNVACVFGPQVPEPMNRPLKDVAFMRTSADLSLYSRLPVGGPLASAFTTKPKLACEPGLDRLGTSAGKDKSTPPMEKTGSPWIWPPPVTFPGVEGAPPRHFPPGAGAMSQGVKFTLVLTLSPEPEPTGPGPFEAPHQLHVASRTPIWPFLTPNTVLPVMLLVLTWISFPVRFQSVMSLVFTPSMLLEIVLFVI